MIDATLKARPAGRDLIIRELHPEVEAGGFACCDQRMQFYGRVNALLRSSMRVLEFGAGRGAWVETMPNGWRKDLLKLKGRCRELIGADIDPAVLNNRTLDRAVMIPPGTCALPIEGKSIDMVVSWATFEHVEHPEGTAAELRRVLKPGGWLCAWTPNRWGYVGIGARLIPNKHHKTFLGAVAPTDKRDADKDVFPTFYRMNTLPTLRRLFPDFDNCSYTWNGPPAYHSGNLSLARLIKLWGKLAPAAMAQSLHIFMRKRG